MIKFIPRLLVWLVAGAVRLALMVVGVFFIPLTFLGDGKDNTPPLWRKIWGNVADVPASHSENLWTKYVWLAWRNPVTGLDSMLEQPIFEKMPNPDMIVREGYAKSAHRWMEDDLFWEYWYLRKVGNKYFEFRVGWKFVDGNEDFVPTFQLGLRGS